MFDEEGENMVDGIGAGECLPGRVDVTTAGGNEGGDDTIQTVNREGERTCQYDTAHWSSGAVLLSESGLK